MRENAGKMRSRITPNTDTFYAVILWTNVKKISFEEMQTVTLFNTKSELS